MNTIHLNQLITYPLKSAAGIYTTKAVVTRRGLANDRHWVIFTTDGNMMTARQHPKLLALVPQIKSTGLHLQVNNDNKHMLINYPAPDSSLTTIKIFSDEATGAKANAEANQWLSDYLGIDCQLFFMNAASNRIALQGRGGQPDDIASYADEAPILLVSTASLANLNRKLELPVSMKHFRPNLVVEGCPAFAEDDWKRIQIGACEFEIAQRCKRCVFTTINPETLEKRKDGEPLRTLATYRKHPRGGVGFGVHLIPRKLGTIQAGDEVKVFT
ncbi:MAG: MOSC domain-containing protein [Flammeovirgaceae bacterium]